MYFSMLWCDSLAMPLYSVIYIGNVITTPKINTTYSYLRILGWKSSRKSSCKLDTFHHWCLFWFCNRLNHRLKVHFSRVGLWRRRCFIGHIWGVWWSGGKSEKHACLCVVWWRKFRLYRRALLLSELRNTVPGNSSYLSLLRSRIFQIFRSSFIVFVFIFFFWGGGVQFRISEMNNSPMMKWIVVCR